MTDAAPQNVPAGRLSNPGMSERTLLVYVDIDGRPCRAGRLCLQGRDGVEHASYEPDREWLAGPHHHTYQRALGLTPGPYFSGGAMPLLGAIGDSAPDRWGRTLMRRNERRAAEREHRAPRIFHESDFLVGVDDEIRSGNLRLREREHGPFLADQGKGQVPGIRQLRRLVQAVRRYEEDRASDAQWRLLLANGQLLGGSRPKASLRDHDGHLVVAKFASKPDAIDKQRWEAACLWMAADSGIAVPAFRLVSVEGERVLVLRRFDREPGTGRRVAFVSMMGLLGARDNKSESYLAMAEAIRHLGGRPRDDLIELWRRAVFTVLISDKDNHLRNHGMYLDRTGWRLALAYDMTPEAEVLRPRMLAISLDGVDDRASLGPLFAHCEDFALGEKEARAMARAIAAKIARWRDYAKALRLSAGEMRRMRGAFEHEALAEALR